MSGVARKSLGIARAGIALSMLVLAAACTRAPVPAATPAPPVVQTMGERTGDDPFVLGPDIKATYWPPVAVESGSASISCDYDYAAKGDGAAIGSVEFFNLAEALGDCREPGTLRVRYRGRIDAGFTALVERVAEMADRMEIATRILDVDSTGGIVEESIKAGEVLADAGWTIWVRQDSVCHSACVLVLAAGDTRSIAGKVGIHRILRSGSKATTREELRSELREVNGQVRDYLERNGVAMQVGDLMMSVANRNLRMLSADELEAFGLDGRNPAQEDLQRIRDARACGDEFARRKAAFARAFDTQCMVPGRAFDDLSECGLALRSRFGFPDVKCPWRSPMAQFDREPSVPETTTSAPLAASRRR